MLTRPEDFIRAFVAGWSARDAQGLADHCAPDAEMLTIGGHWCEGRAEIEAVLTAELTGMFAQSRLVSGKSRLRALGPGAAVLSHRFVITGLVDADGQDAGRVGAMLTAVLVARSEGWQAMQLQLTALAN